MAEKEENKEHVQQIDKIELKNKNGTATVCINLYGATVTSWKINNEEQLFVSSKSKWDQSKAIRGGIPIVFPQYGPGPIKKHGFARVCVWNIDKYDSNSAVLSLSNSDLSDAFKQQFSYKFKLQYIVSIMDNNHLCSKLLITNNETKNAFQFTVLLHTYFKINSKATEILGLKGSNYIDETEGNKIKKEEYDKIIIDKEIDRAYINVNDKNIVLIDKSKKQYQSITIKRTNFDDIVVWNPWSENAKDMNDFDDHEYQHMVCVEPGSVSKSITLKPGQSKLYTQILMPSRLIKSSL